MKSIIETTILWLEINSEAHQLQKQLPRLAKVRPHGFRDGGRVGVQGDGGDGEGERHEPRHERVDDVPKARLD